jgi:hypothetical protein
MTEGRENQRRPVEFCNERRLGELLIDRLNFGIPKLSTLSGNQIRHHTSINSANTEQSNAHVVERVFPRAKKLYTIFRSIFQGLNIFLQNFYGRSALKPFVELFDAQASNIPSFGNLLVKFFVDRARMVIPSGK